MHTYATSIDPPKFSRCDKSTLYVLLIGTHVLTCCDDGHLIIGRIYSDQRTAERVADRLDRWVQIAKCTCKGISEHVAHLDRECPVHGLDHTRNYDFLMAKAHA